VQIILNGESYDLPDDSTLIDLLEILELTTKRLAIELNGMIVQRSKHQSIVINPFDKIEIVQAIGGG